MNTHSYKYKNTIVKGCARSDSIKVFAATSLKDELLWYRKLITKNFNVRQGTHNSLLIMDCNSNQGAMQLNKALHSLEYVKHLERSFRLTFKSFVEGKSVCSEFTPSTPIFTYKDLKLSLSEFLYVSKDSKTLEKFISDNNLKLEDNITFGSDSNIALINLSCSFKEYKDRLFVEMIKPDIL
jgi:hypothetical protein